MTTTGSRLPGTYGQYIDEYKTTSLRLQQLVGERGELTLARTRIVIDDGINNGNGGSGGANNVICDNVTVTCATWSTRSATVTNTVKLSKAITETTLAMYRQEFDFAKATAYVGAETIEVSTDSTTFNNSFTALQAQAGHWAKGTMTATGQGNLTTYQGNHAFRAFRILAAGQPAPSSRRAIRQDRLQRR
jgi:hypothetical protein